jgi:hypothetical protein
MSGMLTSSKGSSPFSIMSADIVEAIQLT